MTKRRIIRGQRVMNIREALLEAVFMGQCAKDTNNKDRLRVARDFIRENFKHRHNKTLTVIGVKA